MVKKRTSLPPPPKKRKGPGRAVKAAKALGAAGVTIASLAALYKLYKKIQDEKAAHAAATSVAANTPLQMQSMTEVGGARRKRRRSTIKRRK